jgi:hypothetical protein
MSHARLLNRWPERDSPLPAQPVACPGCGARFAFCRSRHPAIDACGFESYSFTCDECGASLSGIVDPLDDTLLITKVTA